MQRLCIGLLVVLMHFSGWCQEEWLPFGQGIPILLYHGILEKPDPSRIYETSVEGFRSHMLALKNAGYTTINTHDLLGYFHQKKQIPKKSIMITFDDGEKTSYFRTHDILKELGFQAVMFVIPLMQEDEFPAYLSWEELNQMYKSGRWDIQAHGYKYHNIIEIDKNGSKGNFASNLMWLKDQNRLETIEEYQERLVNDLHKQKQILQQKIPGTQVIAFAYPFGDMGDSAENINSDLASAINETAVQEVFPLSFGTVYFGKTQYTITTRPQLIHRLMDDESFNAEELVKFLQNLQWEQD